MKRHYELTTGGHIFAEVLGEREYDAGNATRTLAVLRDQDGQFQLLRRSCDNWTALFVAGKYDELVQLVQREVAATHALQRVIESAKKFVPASQKRSKGRPKLARVAA